MPAGTGEAGDGAGVPQGLSWSWEMDFGALIASLTGAASPDVGPPDADTAGDPGSDAARGAAGDAARGAAGDAARGAAGDAAGPQTGAVGRPGGAASADEEAVQQAIQDDLDAIDDRDGGASRIPVAALAGRVAERLAPGPDLAAWLAAAPAGGLDDADLAVTAGAWRRVASWAQARELAAVAQITARSAARDEKMGTGPDGRPLQVPVSAAAEVALELTMSQYGATAWAHLAVDLSWRLAATGAALAAGVIDVYRARLIAEATGVLPEEAARAVEARVLPAAGGQTPGMLRAALRRAVIAADPGGAEDRRKAAERQAKVVLYPDRDGTATLAGQGLPAVIAAAAMARITALARARKAAGGGGGGIGLLRSQVLTGLIFGTLPLIPPADGAPPDIPPGDPGPGDGPGDGPRHDPGGGPRDDPGGPADEPGDGPGPGDDPGPGPGPGDDPGPGDGRGDGPGPGDGRGDGPRADRGMGRADVVPPPGDQDAPRDEDDYPCPGDESPGGYAGDDDDDWPGRSPAGEWPALPAVIPPALTRPGDARPADGRPPAGLLDVSLPWQVLAGTSPAPGHLGRIGPITGPQARHLAAVAAADPGTGWRIIITDPAGHALAVTRIPRPTSKKPGTGRKPGAGTRPDAGIRPGAGIGLVGRVTLTIPDNILTHPPPPPEPGAGAGAGAGAGTEAGAGPGTGPEPPGAILALALQAARKAADRARAALAADAAAGGCAHAAASPGYRPPPRLQDYITARDLTCRSPRCRQPAWRGDLDHTIPFDDGGKTCRCNLGGLCRLHHILKHHPDWKLRQTAPGIFTWTTPSGRTYTTTPDTHPL